MSWITIVLLGALTAASCELFSEPGLGDIAYAGETTLCVGDTVPILLRAGGVVLADASLEVISTDPARVAVVAGGTSIAALQQGGNPQLRIWLLSSWVTDTGPTLVQPIDVRSGGGCT
ncbi:MAG: hypothetical protein ACREMV_14345 [Gemmatimonadales bacterium]